MKSPTNYAEWCALFDTITKDIRDETYCQTIAGGTIPWTSGVAERFVQGAATMIRNRVNAAQDKYQLQVKNARGNMNNVLMALQTLKKEYVYDYRLAKALPIPEQHRDQIVKMIQDQADQTQRSLEQSAASDRTGHLIVMIRNTGMNKLNG